MMMACDRNSCTGLRTYPYLWKSKNQQLIKYTKTVHWCCFTMINEVDYIEPLLSRFHCYYFKTKIFIFEYYPNNSSEMNSKHPLNPILIPNTAYVKKKNISRGLYSVGGSQNSKILYPIIISARVC